MPYYCTVPQCTSMAGKLKNVSFHQFPRNEGMARTWNRILRRNKPYTKYSKVCSLHFTPEDYTLGGKGTWKTLRKNALPSRNLPTEDVERRRSRSPRQDALQDNPHLQQQVARAIYIQMMLAWQVVNQAQLAHEDSEDSELERDSSSDEAMEQRSDPQTEARQPSSVQSIPYAEPSTSRGGPPYRCEECMKCFKDPDVLIIHRRTHNGRSTLQANPMLANLLNRQTDRNVDSQLNASVC